mmetsp:Transcript_67037/g.160672  ORF Transcript_67037/g.160672 Transcript_67037/m.160672 type:complete len:168 (-) Transcript_67037:198-701(-)
MAETVVARPPQHPPQSKPKLPSRQKPPVAVPLRPSGYYEGHADGIGYETGGNTASSSMAYPASRASTPRTLPPLADQGGAALGETSAAASGSAAPGGDAGRRRAAQGTGSAVDGPDDEVRKMLARRKQVTQGGRSFTRWSFRKPGSDSGAPAKTTGTGRRSSSTSAS